MELNEYQKAARWTALYKGKETFMGLVYTTLGLNGEAGELADGVKKIWRDDDGKMTEEKRAKLIKELGDVLWYVASTAAELNVTMEDVASINLAKLRKRAEDGKIHGSGDDR